jgi:hypothetical protein
VRDGGVNVKLVKGFDARSEIVEEFESSVEETEIPSVSISLASV